MVRTKRPWFTLLAQPAPFSSAFHADQFIMAHLVERWFGLITEKQFRGTFKSTSELEQAITRYLNWLQ